ncbi:MAG: hypothetical protein QW579_04245 [Desulfurococcaceae archaeon]
MRYLRGDLSAPVLAILVTIGIIAAGLILLAWFWWFAPQAGRVGTLQILGTPAIDTQGNLTLSVKNVGNMNVTIERIFVEGQNCTLTASVTVQPGESKYIIASCPSNVVAGKNSVSGVIVTDHGTYTFTAAVIR